MLPIVKKKRVNQKINKSQSLKEILQPKVLVNKNDTEIFG
jgi:hypothetical protein